MSQINVQKLMPQSGIAPISPEALLLAKVGIDVVKVVIDVLKEYAIAKEIELTKREEFRQNARVAIAQIQAGTSEYLYEVRCSHEERMEVLSCLQFYLAHNAAGHSLDEIANFCLIMIEAAGVGQVSNPCGR